MTSSSSNSDGGLPEGFALTARGLSVTRGGQAILRGIDLAFRAGELVALLGPSGSGKSTLLGALSGFSPGDGQVRLGGRDVYGEFEALKTNVGFVPQDDIVHRSLPVGRALTYAARLRLPADWPSERVDHAVRTVLTEVGLTERAGTRVRNLSGGQRKRVSVAMELLSRPPLLLLDEPTSGLDPALEAQMMRLFRALTGPERLTLVTTHVLASLDQVDLVVMLARGRVVFVGPADEIAAHFEVRDLTEVYRLLATEQAEGWARRWPGSARCHAHVLARLGGTR